VSLGLVCRHRSEGKMSYMPTTMSYLPPMATQVASASWVPPQAVETVMYESAQPVMYESVQAMRAVAQPVVAMAQPVYAQTAVAQSISSYPTAAVGSLQDLNYAINAGEVAKPTGAAAYYDLYCRMNGQAMPTATVVPQQSVYAVEQVMASPSYLPPAQVVYETVPSYAPVAVEKVFMPEYAMAEQMQTYSYMPQYTEPMAVAAPVMAAPVMAVPSYAPAYAPSYAPAMAVAAPGVAMQQGPPESVILDEVGDWLVCEDAAGLFYHHAPTQQSYDDPPLELAQYYERQGIQLAPTGAFGVQAAMVQQAPMQMTYTVAQTMPGAYY